MDRDNRLGAILVKIEQGMKLKAVIELQNVLNNRPEEMDVWYMLGELYYEAGFIDAAGKYWLFYPSNEIRVVKSVDLYRESMNFSASRILKDVKFRGDKAKLPKFSREILEELEKESIENSGKAPTYKRIQHGKEGNRQHLQKNTGCGITVLVVLLGLIAIFVTGIGTIAGYLMGW